MTDMVCKIHVHQREFFFFFISKLNMKNGHLNTVYIFIKNTDKTNCLNYWTLNIFPLCSWVSMRFQLYRPTLILTFVRKAEVKWVYPFYIYSIFSLYSWARGKAEAYSEYCNVVSALLLLNNNKGFGIRWRETEYTNGIAKCEETKYF